MTQKTVVLNGDRINFDGAVDYGILSEEVLVYGDSRPEEIPARAEGCAVVVTKELPMPAEVIEALPPSVRLICEAGTGYNNIDLRAASAKGIAVCHTPAYSTQRVAHTVLLHMLCLASSMGRQFRMLAEGDRRNFTQHLMVPHGELGSKTLGVIGEGAIGREVIRLARALDMKVLVYTRHPEPDVPGVNHLSFEEVLAGCDYLTLHCPLTEQTRHLMDAAALGRLKPTACIINTARGALIDEKALIDALQQGRLAGAGLDVQEEEPPCQGSPLYDMPNVILTPHMGWKGLETRRRLVEMTAENIRSYFAGAPIHIVNG